jgi:two-component system, OmpR family, response regulator VanR
MKKLQKMTLLYAEDELITQTLYNNFFKSYFKAVYTANNGQQAYEMYQCKKPDVAILDINMPLMNGLDLSKKIREKDQKTKIILMTSRIDKEAFLKAVELGLTTYIEKPVTKDILIQSLKKLFDNNSEDEVLWHHEHQIFRWNYFRRELLCNDTNVHLTKNEKSLLETLIKSKHHNVTYQAIFNAVWSDNFDKDYNEASIKTLLTGLRKKLPPKAIKNVYGLGFFLNRNQDPV